MEINSRKRIDYVDIARGLGIILVVWGHSLGPFTNYIYQFHMPFFFILSGVIHNETDSLREFFKKKVNRLYIPFIAWNGLVFIIRGIIEKWPIIGLVKAEILILLTLNKDGLLFGATWFLSSLFTISISYKVIETAMKSVKGFRFIISGIFFIIGVLARKYTLPYMQSRTLICGFFYSIGVLVSYLLKKYSYRPKNEVRIATTIISIVAFIVIGHNNSANMGANKYTNYYLFIVGSALASYVIIELSIVIQNNIRYLKRALIFIGKRSMDIVLFQFVCFRLVVVVQLQVQKMQFSVNKVLATNGPLDASGMWWIAYFLVGLFLPIFICDLTKKSQFGKILIRFHVL